MRTLHKLLCCVAIGLVPASAQADVVSDWAELQTALDKATADPSASFDPEMFQSTSKVCLAMFEAANSIDPRYVSWLKLPRAPAGASGVAAVSAAAHDALLKLYPTQKDKIDNALVLALVNVPPGPDR